MTTSPLSPTTGLVSSLIRGRYDLIDLQRQLSTGKRAVSYGGLDADSRLTILSLRAETSSIQGYQKVIESVNLRLDVAQQTLSRFKDITDQTKTDAYLNPFDVLDGQKTGFQNTASLWFSEMVGLLNQDINERHLFAGRDIQTPPVADAALILQGDGTRAGLAQIIDERRQADVGASGLGRLVVSSPAATTVRIAEEAAGLPFGFKISGATSEAPGVTITGPAGSPAELDIDFGAQLPENGQKIRVMLTLPDGSLETVELTASTTTPLQPGEFLVGADATATAANFQTALQTGISDAADTSLTAASAIVASNEFFAGSNNNPPLRVDGPPFDTATAQIAGTAANTVIWYTGDDAATPARQSALAKIDSSVVVAYGMRADEEAIRNTMSKLGALAAMSFSEADPNAKERYQELNFRIGKALDNIPGQQSMADMMAELASVQRTLASTNERHEMAFSMLEGVYLEREDVSLEEVSAKILSLQTRLQASMETTSILAQLSLTHFI